MVPTVEREFFMEFLDSTAMEGGIPLISSMSGFSTLSKNCLAYVERLSMYLLRPSA